MVVEGGLRNQTVEVQVLALPLTNCVAVLPFLSLSFLTYKVGIIKVPAPQSCEDSVK